MRSFHLLSLLSIVLLLSCSPSQAKHSYGHEKPRVRNRHTNNLSEISNRELKRDANVPFTYFADGLGACGIVNAPSDFIVALNSAEYGDGHHCFQMITITVDGKTAQAQITDECAGCPPGGLDFSQSLFEYFAPLGKGELYGSWSYNSDVATSSSTSSPPTTYYAPTSTTATTTTSSSATPSATITTSLVPTTVPTSTQTASIVPTSTPQGPQVIMQINLAVVGLGSLLGVSLEL